MKSLESIRREIGESLFDQWKERANHEYKRAQEKDLTRGEYVIMSVRWQYAQYKEGERAFKARSRGLHK